MTYYSPLRSKVIPPRVSCTTIHVSVVQVTLSHAQERYIPQRRKTGEYPNKSEHTLCTFCDAKIVSFFPKGRSTKISRFWLLQKHVLKAPIYGIHFN